MGIKIKKKLRGEDDTKTFSIRIPSALCDKLDKIADEANISRNALIKILLEKSVDSVEVE